MSRGFQGGRFRLTDRFIATVKARDSWSRDYWDADAPGLVLRVSPRGSRAFFVIYRAGGRKRRLRIGAYPVTSLDEARRLARKALGSIAGGADPQGDVLAARRAETFGELAELYLERHARRHKKDRGQEDERQLRKDLLPAWGSIKAREIRRRDVIRLAEDVAAGAVGGRNGQPAPVAANRLIALVSRIFTFAVDQEILETSPAVRIPRMAREQSRDRVLSTDELRILWPALDSLHPITAAFWRLILLTAQRPGEVQRMRWRDLDGDGWWHLPAEFTKNGRAHRVPLSPPVLEIVEALRPLTGAGEWVLESFRKEGAPIGRTQNATAKLIRDTALPHFTPHDCRRTAATWMAAHGVSPLVVDRILNHTPRGVTAIYIRAQDAEVRRALLQWGERLAAIVSGADRSAEVEPLRGRR